MRLKYLLPLCIAVIGLACTWSTPHRAYAEASRSGSSASTNIVVQTVPGPTVTQKVATQFKSSWPWYLVRGSGFVAAISLFILILSGIGQVTGYTYKFLEPLTAWASHRALGIVFGLSVTMHILGLLFDHFLPFTIGQVLVPWLSHYRPVTLWGHHFGSLWVALGIFAFYLTVIVVISSLLWIDKKPHTWKWLHILSYVLISLVFIHALYIGTDTAYGLVRLVWIAGGIGIVAAILHRLWRAYTA